MQFAAVLLTMVGSIAGSTVIQARREPTFQLLPGDCNLYPECQPGRQHKLWTAIEERVVTDALIEIGRSSRGNAAIQAVNRIGIRSIRRYDVGADNEGHLQPTQMASFSRRGAFLEVDDRFFSYAPYRDTRSGFGLTAEILLHELFHVIDDSGLRFSSTKEFRRALGLIEQPDHRLWPDNLTAEKISEHDTVGLESARLTSTGEFGRAWDLRRDFAVPLGLPTMRALDRWDEAFAEIGAHIVLDWTANSYMKKPVIEYFEERVFSRLDSLR